MTERFQSFANSISNRLERLCAGSSENQFDAWHRKDFYPVLAVWLEMPLGINEKLYESRLIQLREGEPENEYDAWLKDRFYPIEAGFTAPDSCGKTKYLRLTKFGNKGIID